MRFGVHISISGKLSDVVERAVERNCETIQIFTRNPRGWALPKKHTPSEIQLFKDALKSKDIHPLIVHLPYLPNIASPKSDLYNKSVDMLISDLKEADKLGAAYVIVHAGSCPTSEQEGLELITNCINCALKIANNEVMVLIENQAGGGSELCYKFSHFGIIFEQVEQINKVGICFDVCHAYLAGYDVTTEEGLNKTLEEIDKTIGIDKIKVLHLSDTKHGLGSKKDTHADIGSGNIKNEGFKIIINNEKIKDLPAILETPIKTVEDDIRNLSVIRSLKI